MEVKAVSCQDLCSDNGHFDLVQRENLRQQRREKDNAHQYKAVRTKEPHGGKNRAARVIGFSIIATDNALQIESRKHDSEVPREPGHERVDVSPTTNFVGDHMTQAAIDLVHSRLESTLSTNFQNSVVERQDVQLKPVSVERRTLLAVDATQRIDRYGWYDCGAYAKLEISLPTPIKKAQCEFTIRTLRVSLLDIKGITHSLRLSHLVADLAKNECHWFVRGCKLFVILMKMDKATWSRLCETLLTGTPLPKSDAFIDDLRKPCLLRTTRSFSDEEKDNQTTFQPTEPFTKITRDVCEDDVVTVHKQTQDGIECERNGDYIGALEAFGKALEELSHVTSGTPTRCFPATQASSKCDDQKHLAPRQLFRVAADLHHRMADCCIHTGYLREAVQFCSASIQELRISRVENVDLIAAVLLIRASALEALEDYKAAQRDFREVLKHRRSRKAIDGFRRMNRFRLRS